MKKQCLAVSILIVIVMISIPFCWAGSTPKGKLEKDFIFGAPAGASAYAHGAIVSELLNRNLKNKMRSAIESVPNPVLIFKFIMSGESHCVPFSNAVAYDAYQGKKPFPFKARLRNLLSGSFPAATIMAFVVRSDSGIKTVSDLKGKSVYAELTRGPIVGMLSESIFQANGMSKDDVNWIKYSSLPEAFREVKEGRVDAIFGLLGTASQDMAETVGAHVIPMNSAEIKAGQTRVPGYTPMVVPKGYKGTGNDGILLGSAMCYWVSNELSELTAYTVVKTLFENIDKYHEALPEAKGFSTKNALSSWNIPYHPGSILYFKEIGIWGADEDKKQKALLEAEKKLYGE